jgi:hypothetical protein
MAKRATLELLRAVRKRDAEATLVGAAHAARARAEAERAADAAMAAGAHARADVEGAIRAEREHVDGGRATAGDLARAHHHRVAAEARAEQGARAGAQAAEGAARARAHEQHAAAALEQALARKSRVSERIGDESRRDRARLEHRDEEGILDAWNARHGKGRSPG